MSEKHLAKINEIFDSIQGEGPYIGYRQLFVRFCGCNLLCDYCDTEFNNGEKFSADELVEKITKEFDLKHIHSISLTGGEPLLQYEFLKEFLPKLKQEAKEVKTYLETNGTLEKPLAQVIDFCDIISMDFKIDSSTKIGDLFSLHDKFLKIATDAQKDVFAKLVFDDKIEDFEIHEAISLAQKYKIPIILQPKMLKDKIGVSHDKIVQVFNTFTDAYPDTRLIGQVHKFFDIR